MPFIRERKILAFNEYSFNTQNVGRASNMRCFCLRRSPWGQPPSLAGVPRPRGCYNILDDTHAHAQARRVRSTSNKETRMVGYDQQCTQELRSGLGGRSTLDTDIHGGMGLNYIAIRTCTVRQEIWRRHQKNGMSVKCTIQHGILSRSNGTIGILRKRSFQPSHCGAASNTPQPPPI